MKKQKIAGKFPQKEQLKSGQTYAWCACGMSVSQPWCDGSHKGTGFSPTIFKVGESKIASMCMCKQTKNLPFCDGEHRNL